MPMVRWFMRRLLATLYGMEIGPDVQLGHGVYFVHTLGVVLGKRQGGARVRFYGEQHRGPPGTTAIP